MGMSRANVQLLISKHIPHCEASWLVTVITNPRSRARKTQGTGQCKKMTKCSYTNGTISKNDRHLLEAGLRTKVRTFKYQKE